MATLLEIAEELYALDPDDFIPARDARAKELKGTELATSVKKLRKPSTAAWAVNLLAREDGAQMEQLVGLGESLRQAQAELDPVALRDLNRQRRQVTAAVAGRAAALAEEHGVRVTGSVADQVEATLTAAMIDADAGRAVRSGLLVGALSATGVDPVDVAAAVAAADVLGFEPLPADGSRRRHLRAVPDVGTSGSGRGKQAAERAAEREAEQAAEELADARQDLEEAEDDVASAEEHHAAAEGEATRLEERSRAVADELEELRDRMAELQEEAHQLNQDLRTAAKLRDRAARTLRDATRRRDETADRLRELEGG